MPRVTHVKAAQKDYPEHGIKKGEPYYWWKFMVGGRGGPKQFSKTPPKAAQLTQSAFLSQIYDINDRVESLEAGDHEELESNIQELAEEFRAAGEECSENLSNMPEGLQQGSTGELLQQRADDCESIASELESIDCSWDEDEALETATKDVVTTWENDGPERVDDPAAAYDEALQIAADIDEHFNEARDADLQEKISEAQGNTYQGD